MSNHGIDCLVRNRSLIHQSFDDDQVVGYWTRALGSLRDSQAHGLSANGVLEMAYDSALRASVAVLAAHDLKVLDTSTDDVAFDAVRELSAARRDRVLPFEELLADYQSIYEPRHDEEEEAQQRLTRAMAAIREGLPAARAEIVATRPSLASKLAPPAL